MGWMPVAALIAALITAGATIIAARLKTPGAKHSGAGRSPAVSEETKLYVKNSIEQMTKTYVEPQAAEAIAWNVKDRESDALRRNLASAVASRKRWKIGTVGATIAAALLLPATLAQIYRDDGGQARDSAQTPGVPTENVTPSASLPPARSFSEQRAELAASDCQPVKGADPEVFQSADVCDSGEFQVWFLSFIGVDQRASREPRELMADTERQQNPNQRLELADFKPIGRWSNGSSTGTYVKYVEAPEIKATAKIWLEQDGSSDALVVSGSWANLFQREWTPGMRILEGAGYALD